MLVWDEKTKKIVEKRAVETQPAESELKQKTPVEKKKPVRRAKK